MAAILLPEGSSDVPVGQVRYLRTRHCEIASNTVLQSLSRISNKFCDLIEDTSGRACNLR